MRAALASASGPRERVSVPVGASRKAASRGLSGSRRPTKKARPEFLDSEPDGSADGRRVAGEPTGGSLQCRHFSSGCSGCSLEHRLREPPLYEAAKRYFLGKGLDQFPMVAGPLHGWRCRAKLAVRGRRGRALVGLFATGTHTVPYSIPDCAIHASRINDAVELVLRLVNALGVAPYEDSSGRGALRYLQMTALPRPSRDRAEEDPDAVVQLVLVCNAAKPGDAAAVECKQLARQLWAAADAAARGAASPSGGRPPLFHSIWLNFQPVKERNTILGPDFELLHGPEAAWQEFGGARIALGPGKMHNRVTTNRLILPPLLARSPRVTCLLARFGGSPSFEVVKQSRMAACFLAAPCCRRN